MKLATHRDDTPDGRLVVVSRDGTRAAPADAIAATLQAAVERWTHVEPVLRTLANAVERGTAPGLTPLNVHALTAPLPRAWRWLDGSAYPSHGELMQRAFALPPLETDRPLMYQGLSNKFYSAFEDIPCSSEADGIDFEGEFGVIVDHVAMGMTADHALGHVRLIVQINDWSLRAIAPAEMRTGFGWVQAKPACSMAPFAITPDELGPDWQDGRVAATLRTSLNGESFGAVHGADGMQHGFDTLIAHAARTRDLCAGTIIGSGTVSSPSHSTMGSSCISERRAIEMIETGNARTPFLRSGDQVTMDAADHDGRSLFGRIDQKIVLIG